MLINKLPLQVILTAPVKVYCIAPPVPIVRVPFIVQLPTKVTVQDMPIATVPIPKSFGQTYPLLIRVTEVLVLVVIRPDPPTTIVGDKVTPVEVPATVLPTVILLVMVMVLA